MAKLVKQSVSLARRVTGFSLPFFGLQWKPSVDQREIIRRVIAVLEDKRALYAPLEIETPDFVRLAIDEIRAELTKAKVDLGEDSEALQHLEALRAACRAYSDAMDTWKTESRFYEREAMFVALGSLRSTFGLHVYHLASMYGIQVESGLSSIFPPLESVGS